MTNKDGDLLQSLDLDKIRAASQQAAWGSLLGGLIIVIAIAFSVIRIRQLDRDVAVKSKTVKELEDAIEPLEAQKIELEGQLSAGKTRLAGLQDQLATAESDLEKAKEQEQLALAKKAAIDRQLSVARDSKDAFEQLVSANFSTLQDMDPAKSPAELLRVGVVPKVSADPVKTDGGKPQFSFALWLDYRDKQVKRVADEQLESVVYTFNHISFGKTEQDRQRKSDDRESGYRETYTGWGAMSNVIIELRLRNGNTVKLDFDMHAALPPELDVPVKGPPIKRPPAVLD